MFDQEASVEAIKLIRTKRYFARAFINLSSITAERTFVEQRPSFPCISARDEVITRDETRGAARDSLGVAF